MTIVFRYLCYYCDFLKGSKIHFIYNVFTDDIDNKIYLLSSILNEFTIKPGANIVSNFIFLMKQR